MPSWVIKLLTALITNWGGKVLDWVIDVVKRYADYKNIGKESDMQADKVKAISDEIKKLIEAGQPVPQELKQRLRDESRRLIDAGKIKND